MIMASSDIARRIGRADWMMRTEYEKDGKKITYISEYVQITFAGAMVTAFICLVVSGFLF